MGSQWGHSGDTVGTRAPDPYHGYPTRSAPSPHTPLPRVPHYPGWCTDRECYPCSVPGSGSPGFFRIQSLTYNTELSKTTTFLTSKTDLSKLHFFVKKPTLRKKFFRKCHFWRFCWKSPKMTRFWDTTGLWLFLTVFHCSRSVRFPLGFWQKVQNVFSILAKSAKWPLFAKIL